MTGWYRPAFRQWLSDDSAGEANAKSHRWALQAGERDEIQGTKSMREKEQRRSKDELSTEGTKLYTLNYRSEAGADL